jgi:tagatose-6-phosphate ketose/aldose isomerase
MDKLRPLVAAATGVVLTGSGSSQYAGECVAYAFQAATDRLVRAIPSGELLVLGPGALPPLRPLLVVSFARSGNSPESGGLIRQLLDNEPEVRHLVLTCNRAGRVAEAWGGPNGRHNARVEVITLDDRTCDRSLVMTSSFTNLVLAGLGLAYLDRAGAYTAAAQVLARQGRHLLTEWTDRLAAAAVEPYTRFLVLGDGASFGAAREGALKMLEMTDGRVLTMAETFLGFRHGPMCALNANALLLALLSSDPHRRAYQLDLLDEIRRKGLGGWKIVVGAQVPSEALTERDVALEMPELANLSDDWAAILHAVVGQLLGFFRCRAEGLQPDQPAATGAISRVVGEFPLHGIVTGVGG